MLQVLQRSADERVVVVELQTLLDILGEVLKRDDGSFAAHEGVLDDILQFSHVPGVRVILQEVQRVGSHLSDVPAQFAIELVHKVLDQKRHILTALA